MDLFTIVVETLPLLVVVLGLLLSGMAGFTTHLHSERKWAARIGVLLIVLGVCGIIWPIFVLLYLVLVILGLLTFAGIGLYRSFG